MESDFLARGCLPICLYEDTYVFVKRPKTANDLLLLIFPGRVQCMTTNKIKAAAANVKNPKCLSEKWLWTDQELLHIMSKNQSHQTVSKWWSKLKDLIIWKLEYHQQGNSKIAVKNKGTEYLLLLYWWKSYQCWIKLAKNKLWKNCWKNWRKYCWKNFRKCCGKNFRKNCG